MKFVDWSYLYWQRSSMADRWLLPLATQREFGVEIGASSHNSFGIPSINVDFTKDVTIWKEEEVKICGHARTVDVVAMADDLPFLDSSFGFLINSHVFEHQANPIKCLLEWGRVVEHGGIIFTVIPHRDALDIDAVLPLTPLGDMIKDYYLEQDTETHPVIEGHGKYGHYLRLSPLTFLALVKIINLVFGVPFGIEFELMDFKGRDDKVGNGFVFVHRVIKTEILFPSSYNYINSSQPKGRKVMKRPRAVFTQIHNEPVFMNLWLKYYSQFFDPEDIYVLHNLKTKELDFDRWLPTQQGFVRIPNTDTPEMDFQVYVDRINYLQRELLKRYEVVLLAEIDEFVAHPDGLSTYINNWTGDVAVCKGYEVVHKIDEEPPLDLSRPIMAQRKWWYPCHLYDKPLLSRIPLTYGYGCHHCNEVPWETTDPELLLIHLHKVDYDLCVHRKLERMKNEPDSELMKNHSQGTLGWQNYITEFNMKEWWYLNIDNGSRAEHTEIPEQVRRLPL